MIEYINKIKYIHTQFNALTSAPYEAKTTTVVSLPARAAL